MGSIQKLSSMEEDVGEELVEPSKGPDNLRQVQYPLQASLYLLEIPKDDQASTPMADLALLSCYLLRYPWPPSDSFAALPEDPRVPYIAAPYSGVILARPSRSLTLADSLGGPCRHCGSRSDRVQNAMIVKLLLRCSIEGSLVSGGV